jgi:hypothetical protein
MRSLETSDGEGVSPFRRETFEPILKICGSQLDPEGRYLPDHRVLQATDPVPEPDGEFLTVSDRFALYARRRSTNSVLRDIERLKTAISPEEAPQSRSKDQLEPLSLGLPMESTTLSSPLGTL